MIKLIASDIDGTLVPDGTHEIDVRMYDVIKRLKEHGIIYVGASGRQFASMAKLFQPVKEDIYYITDNGAILRDAGECGARRGDSVSIDGTAEPGRRGKR